MEDKESESISIEDISIDDCETKDTAINRFLDGFICTYKFLIEDD